jgi:hypothetical protein
MTTTETLTVERLDALARGAGEAGDTEMVRICETARPLVEFGSDGYSVAAEIARDRVVRVINETEAMMED